MNGFDDYDPEICRIQFERHKRSCPCSHPTSKQ